MTKKMTAEKLYNEFVDSYEAYNAHRKAAFKARVTRLAKRTSHLDNSYTYLETIATALELELPIAEAKPKSFLLPIYKVQLVRDSSQTANHKQVTSPMDAATILSTYLAHADREHVVVMMLDTKSNIIGINTVSIGTLGSSLVSPREVFKPALLSNAASIIIAHNHPSGDPTPSPQDVIMTKNLVQAGHLLDCEVSDHIIIGHERWVSLKERGLGF